MNWQTDLPGLAQALGLKRVGSEYHGPCVECGGRDRFFASRGKSHDILVACRRGCSFGVIAKHLTDMGLIDDTRDFDKVKYKLDQTELEDNLLISLAKQAKREGTRIHYKDQQKIRQALAREEQREKYRMGVANAG
jgi:hypothetical protein